MNITLFGSSKSIMETFHLNGMIFDYGQNIISIEIETNKLKNIDEKSLDIDTFKVHAKGELPKVNDTKFKK